MMKCQFRIMTYLLLALQMLFLSCGNEGSKKSSNIMESSEWHYLENENIKLRLPLQFKRSSRFRIKEDMPTLLKDT